MTACHREGTCNFTTIGGIFELLKYAVYERRGLCRRLPGYEGAECFYTGMLSALERKRVHHARPERPLWVASRPPNRVPSVRFSPAPSPTALAAEKCGSESPAVAVNAISPATMAPLGDGQQPAGCSSRPPAPPPEPARSPNAYCESPQRTAAIRSGFAR
jgi:hypothetical protein